MNKFEHYINQAQEDTRILYKLKSELNKLKEKDDFHEIIDQTSLEYYMKKIDNALTVIKESVTLENIKEINQNFNIENLSPQYKELYDNLELKNYFNTKIADFKEEVDSARKIENYSLYRDIINNAIVSLGKEDYKDNIKVQSLYKLRNIKDININMVLIGKNGAGKSSFISSFKEDISDNIYTIDADRILSIRGLAVVKQTYNSLKELFEDAFINNKKNNYNLTNFEIVIDFLIKHEMYESSKDKKDRLTTKVFNIMNKIFPYLKLYIETSEEVIKVNNKNDNFKGEYSLDNMSSGEKSALYFISIVIMSNQNSYLLVDEPEINLNPYLNRKLWDILEEEKKDSIFIYATHDKDFASSRLNSEYVWMKSYTPPEKWDYKTIDNKKLPKELLFDLLGEENKKLLVEGTYSSLDYHLYNVLFKEYQVVPMGGHKEVIRAQRVINSDEFYMESIGIIDRDNYPTVQLENYQKHNIYALDYNEIENLLYRIALDYGTDLPLEIKSKVDMVKKDYVDLFIQEVDLINNELMKHELLYNLEGISSFSEFEKKYDEFEKSTVNDRFNDFFDFTSGNIINLEKMLVSIPLKDAISEKLCFKIIDFIQSQPSILEEVKKEYFKWSIKELE